MYVAYDHKQDNCFHINSHCTTWYGVDLDTEITVTVFLKLSQGKDPYINQSL